MKTLRTDEAAALPSPQVVLSCSSTGTTAASDAHPASDPLPGATGYRTPRSGDILRRSPGRGGPPQFPPPPSIRSAPPTQGSSSRLRSRLFTASMAFTPITGARRSLAPPSQAGMLAMPQASRHATDRIVAPPHSALDAGLRPGPFPDRAASLLPGLLAATRTGLPPAGDDELTNTKIHLGHSFTSRPTGRTQRTITSDSSYAVTAGTDP